MKEAADNLFINLFILIHNITFENLIKEILKESVKKETFCGWSMEEKGCGTWTNKINRQLKGQSGNGCFT